MLRSRPVVPRSHHDHTALIKQVGALMCLYEPALKRPAAIFGIGKYVCLSRLGVIRRAEHGRVLQRISVCNQPQSVAAAVCSGIGIHAFVHVAVRRIPICEDFSCRHVCERADFIRLDRYIDHLPCAHAQHGHSALNHPLLAVRDIHFQHFIQYYSLVGTDVQRNSDAHFGHRVPTPRDRAFQ